MAKLYVVATPIGNLSDITPRMRDALTSSALIAAEDTRVTQKLLSHLNISRPMVSNHQHNEAGRAPQLIARMLDEDIDVALTCDAGTPGISDPGMELVAAAWDAGIEIEPIPGPSAVVTALSVAGFNAREFAFYGFLPRENGDLRKKLAAIAAGPRIAVAYESPHRILNLVERIDEALPTARVCVCCDLTKRYEKVERGAVGEVLQRLRANENIEKGEYCVVIELPEHAEQIEPEPKAISPRHMMLDALMEGLSTKEAVKRLTQAGIPRQQAYDAGLELKRFLEERAES